MLKEASDLLNKAEGRAAAGQPLQTVTSMESMEELEGLGYVCDESGCVLVFSENDGEDGGARARIATAASHTRPQRRRMPAGGDASMRAWMPLWIVHTHARAC